MKKYRYWCRQYWPCIYLVSDQYKNSQYRPALAPTEIECLQKKWNIFVRSKGCNQRKTLTNQCTDHLYIYWLPNTSIKYQCTPTNPSLPPCGSCSRESCEGVVSRGELRRRRRSLWEEGGSVYFQNLTWVGLLEPFFSKNTYPTFKCFKYILLFFCWWFFSPCYQRWYQVSFSRISIKTLKF